MDCVPWIWRFIVTTIGRFLIKNLKVARNKQVRQLWVFMFSFSTVLNITIYNCHRWHFSERVTRPIFHNDCVHAQFHRCDRSSTCACFWSMQPVDSLSGTSTDLGGKRKKKIKGLFLPSAGRPRLQRPFCYLRCRPSALNDNTFPQDETDGSERAFLHQQRVKLWKITQLLRFSKKLFSICPALVFHFTVFQPSTPLHIRANCVWQLLLQVIFTLKLFIKIS